MKEVKQLKKEMLETPGWTREKSVEIAIFAAKSCGNETLPDRVSKAWKQKKRLFWGGGYGGDTDYFRARAARFAIESSEKRPDKKIAKKAAKAIVAAAHVAWFENGKLDYCENTITPSDKHYDEELKRLRKQIKSM